MDTIPSIEKIKPKNLWQKCPNCMGHGTLGYAKKPCISCLGKGVLSVPIDDAGGIKDADTNHNK